MYQSVIFYDVKGLGYELDNENLVCRPCRATVESEEQHLERVQYHKEHYTNYLGASFKRFTGNLFPNVADDS